MQIGFGILLEHEPHNFIREYQLKFHHELSILPGRQNPHITFKSPFKVHDIEAYVDYFDQLARETQPFEVKINGVGDFDQKILFLDVEENQATNSLHVNVLKQMKDQFNIDPDPLEGENMHFHASIAELPTKDAFIEAKEMLENEAPKFRFWVKEFGIFYHLGGDHSWIIFRRMPIGGERMKK
jgi:2'-5' RNA ligase